MKKSVRMRILALVCAMSLGLTMTACGRKKEEGAVTLKEGVTFSIAVAQEPDNFNPVLSEGGLAEEFFLLCYDPLWRINAQGDPVPCLVEDHSLSSDSLTWTIRLKKGVTFSDGTEVTAQDVAFSYEMMRSYSQLYAGYFDGITGIRCPDDYTVVISTEYVKGDMMYNPTPILPRSVWGDYEFSPENFDNAALVGSGPFVYDAVASGEEGWVFRAREGHPMGEAQVGTIVFVLHSTVTGAARAIAAGEVDAGFGMTDVQLTTLEEVPGVELVQAMLPSGDCWALVFNLQSSYCESSVMRQAFEQCTDREWLLSMACGGAGITGSTFVSPGTDYFAQISGVRSYVPASAQWSFQANGYVDVDSDGFLEYGTNNLTMRPVLYSSNQDAWSATAGTILTADLAEIGVDVNWKKTDETVTVACKDPEDWDMCLTGWKGGRNPVVAADAFAETMAELAGWTNASYDSILTQLRSAMDETTVLSLTQQLQQIAYNECPCVVLAYTADIQAIRKDTWTGYEEILASGGLFGMGCADVYMSVMPVEAAEETK